MTVSEIHKAIIEGKTVHWGNPLYKVYRNPIRQGRYEEFDLNHHSHKDGYILEIRCTSNWFGGLAHENEIKECFIAS